LANIHSAQDGPLATDARLVSLETSSAGVPVVYVGQETEAVPEVCGVDVMGAHSHTPFA
jgi:hypothetical protein